MSKTMLTKTANAFERIIGSSSFRNPYQTHNESPVTKTMIIHKERSLTSFSFQTLMSCGNIATEVIPPATKPKMLSFILKNLEI